MTKPIGREERLQKAVVQHLRFCLPENVVFYAIPNAPRSKVAGARLKAMGMLAGAADLAFVLPGGVAAFIELKVEKSIEGDRTYLDPAQREFRDAVEIAGARFAMCRSLDQVMTVLIGWGVKLRGWK